MDCLQEKKGLLDCIYYIFMGIIREELNSVKED